MHRIDSATKSVDENGAGKDGFTEGSHARQIAPTRFTGDWLNAVQEEIASTIEGAGLTLSKPSNAQLLAAVRALVKEFPSTVISPASIGTDQNNWNPTGLSTANMLIATSSADVSVTGLVPGSAVGALFFVNGNATGGYTFALPNDSGSSTAANRFYGLHYADTTLKPGDSVLLVRDTGASRWRVIGGSLTGQAHDWTGSHDWTLGVGKTFRIGRSVAGDVVSIGNTGAAEVKVDTTFTDGNVLVKEGTLTVGESGDTGTKIQARGSIAATKSAIITEHITSTTGNISAEDGDVNAAHDVTAGGNVVAEGACKAGTEEDEGFVYGGVGYVERTLLVPFRTAYVYETGWEFDATNNRWKKETGGGFAAFAYFQLELDKVAGFNVGAMIKKIQVRARCGGTPSATLAERLRMTLIKESESGDSLAESTPSGTTTNANTAAWQTLEYELTDPADAIRLSGGFMYHVRIYGSTTADGTDPDLVGWVKLFILDRGPGFIP